MLPNCDILYRICLTTEGRIFKKCQRCKKCVRMSKIIVQHFYQMFESLLIHFLFAFESSGRRAGMTGHSGLNYRMMAKRFYFNHTSLQNILLCNSNLISFKVTLYTRHDQNPRFSKSLSRLEIYYSH